jgi:glycolate oxidase FAD binding subunit
VIVAESLRELVDAAGEGGVETHAPVAFEGAEVSATLRPADGEALARVITAMCRLGLAAVVRGSGSGLALGNPPRGVELFLSLERLAGVDELDEVDGVCRVAAGTPLAALRDKLAATAWELPLDAPGAAATVGGCLAGARIGPRSLGFGLPRDVQLGLDMTLGSGERTRCGGRVVKNVTGYDLGKLYTGSQGSLGVIEAAWLRLRPKPECVRTLEVEIPDVDGACAAGLGAARRVSARAVVVSVAVEGARRARCPDRWRGSAGPHRGGGSRGDRVRAAVSRQRPRIAPVRRRPHAAGEGRGAGRAARPRSDPRALRIGRCGAPPALGDGDRRRAHRRRCGAARVRTARRQERA